MKRANRFIPQFGRWRTNKTRVLSKKQLGGGQVGESLWSTLYRVLKKTVNSPALKSGVTEPSTRGDLLVVDAEGRDSSLRSHPEATRGTSAEQFGGLLHLRTSVLTFSFRPQEIRLAYRNNLGSRKI